jgi:hypothetical protein
MYFNVITNGTHNRMARDTVTAAVLDNQQRSQKQLLAAPSSRSPVRASLVLAQKRSENEGTFST